MIDKQLDQLRAQLADLPAHYTEKHPDVRKTKEQIERVEKTRAQIVAGGMNSGVERGTGRSGATRDRRARPFWRWKAS